MKDAGLDIEDLDSFSMDQTTSGSQLDLGFNTHINMNPTSIQSTQDSSQLPVFNQMNPMDVMQQDNQSSAASSRQQTSQQAIFGQQQIQISGQQNSGQIIGIGADGIISSSHPTQQQQQQAQIIGNQSVQIIGQQQPQSAGEITTTNSSLSYAMTSGGIIEGGQPQISSLPVSLQEHGSLQSSSQSVRVQNNLQLNQQQNQMSNTSVNNGRFSINASGVRSNQVVVSSAGSGGQQMISQQQGITINSSGQLISGDGGSISSAGFPPGSSFQLMRVSYLILVLLLY